MNEDNKILAEKLIDVFKDEYSKYRMHRIDVVNVLKVAIKNRKIAKLDEVSDYYVGVNAGLDIAIDVLNEYMSFLGNTKQDETSDQ